MKNGKLMTHEEYETEELVLRNSTESERREAYAKDEAREASIQQEEEEWNEGDFDDTEAQIAKDESDEELKGEAKREKAHVTFFVSLSNKLDGLIVNTLWEARIYPSDMVEMNRPHCRLIRITATSHLGINRHFSASNFRRRW